MEKKALSTEQVKLGNRTIYMDIKETKKGDNYLVISEVKKLEDNQVERKNFFIFENEIEAFGSAFLRTMLQFKRTDIEIRKERAKEKYPNAFEKWSKKDDADLALMFSEGKTVEELAEHFQRNTGGIKARIEKLELTKAEVAA